MVRCLLERYDVLWVNTIGTRAPRLDLYTARRALGRLAEWARAAARPRPAAEPPAPGRAPRVTTPLMWPWFGSVTSRALNRGLLAAQLRGRVAAAAQPVVAITTVPLLADMVGRLPVARWVYYCVDDFSAWPGLDQRTLDRMERALVERVDAAVAVSDTLRERLAGMGREAPVITHGVDLDHWLSVAAAGEPPLAGLERPLVLFWGVVDRRMDVDLLRRLATDLEHGTIALAGPLADPDPSLAALPRVALAGTVPYQRLPQLAREAAVLVMPYADLAVTRAMQPLKLKEYLATGKPVVVRDLPATRPWHDALDIAASPEAFSAAVRRRLAEGVPAGQRAARQRLSSESWQAKAEQLARLAIET